MKYLKTISFLLLALFPGLLCSKSGSIYYIDGEAGNDSNSGHTPRESWRSIARVNRASFQPGDKIFFKAGSRWRETLIISHSGTTDHPVIYDAFGAGPKPSFVAWDTLKGSSSDNFWRIYQDSIWYCENITDPRRVWLDGTEFPCASEPAAIDKEKRWFYQSSSLRLYLYARINPARFYSDISAATIRETALLARRTDHIILRNLAFEGGSLYSIHLNHSHEVTIENCEIGKNSGSYGALISQSDRGVIRNSIIDSGHRFRYEFPYEAVQDGIKLYSGCNDWRIYQNEIRDWGHSCVQIQSRDPREPTSHNKIFQNTISAPEASYCRGFELAGPEGSCRFNEIFRNIIAFTSVRNQVAGSDNLIHHNIFHDLANVAYREDGTAQIISFSNHEGNACHDIGFYHNVLLNSDEPGIRLVSHGRETIRNIAIKNNIIYNCGKNSKEGLTGVSLFVASSDEILNLDIQHNDFFRTGDETFIDYRGVRRGLSRLEGSNLSGGDIITANIEQDPLFISVSNNKFDLRAGSPCIGKGMALGFEQDFAGNPIPAQGPVDIGAFQSQQSDR